MPIHEVDIEWLRITEACAVLILWTRSLYFFQMFNSFAPIVHTIYACLYEVAVFLLPMIIFFIMFMQAYSHVFRNQM